MNTLPDRRSRPYLACFLLFLAPAPVVAQTDPLAGFRERVGGRLQTAVGDPWTDAEVHFFARPVPGRSDVGEADHLVTRSDERGRFELMILPTRRYDAWAVEKSDQGVRVSDLVTEIVPRMPVRLVEAERRSLTLKLRGLEPYLALGVSRLRVVWPSANLHVAELPVRAEKLVIPPQAAASFWIELWNESGPVAVRGIGGGDVARGDLDWALPDTDDVEVRVTSGDEPVAGAEIWQQLYQGDLSVHGESVPSHVRRWRWQVGDANPRIWSLRGRTGADGTAKIPLLNRHEVVVRAAGFLPGWNARRSQETSLDFDLAEGPVVRGRVLRRSGEPAAGMLLWARSENRAQTGPGSSRSFVFDAPPVRCAEDGSFEFHGLANGVAFRIEGLLPEPTAVRLWPSGAPPAPRALIAVGAARKDGDATDLGVVDLSQLTRLRVAVQRPDGVPARDAEIVLRPKLDGGGNMVPRPIALQGDRRGQTSMLIPPGTYYALIVSSTEGHLFRTIETAELGDGVLTATLAAYPRVLVSVKDAQGQPVADAQLQSSGGSYSHLDVLFAEAFAWNQALIGSVRTDARGQCRMPVMPWRGQSYSLRATKQVDGRSIHSPGGINVSSDQIPEELDLQLDGGDR